jgi:hypothetical protein
VFEDLDVVKIQKDYPEHKLKAGNIGTVILQVSSNEYDVEFVDEEGYTIAVLTLPETDLEKLN